MGKKAIKCSNAPAAIGPYSQAIVIGNLMFISGQIPVDPITNNVVEGGIQAQTKQCMKNIEAICQEAGGTLDNVIKTTVFVKDLTQFGVVNNTYGEFFNAVPPARACVEVARLPKDVLVEIEAIVLVN